MKTDQFARRHIGITERDLPEMLNVIGVKSVDELIDQVFPQNIRLKKPMQLPETLTEQEFFNHIRALAQKNELFDNYIGLGYSGVISPAVIVRNVLENPIWYTSYTPYQAEISQGRLEALLNFQTMVCDLTALPLTNCSLLDEGTAAAEAMTMMHNVRSREQQKAGINTLFVDKNIFPQTLAVIRTRALPQGIDLLVGDFSTFDFSTPIFGAIVQYPNNDGNINCYAEFTEKCHTNNARIAVAADIMSLVLLTPPGEWGADIVLGTTQRMGIPMYYGGPAAAYLASTEDFKRLIPGRIIGISKDANDKKALRLALQTREQHIKREKATSNVCTAQALLATMAGFYAAYHGNEGLQDIAMNIHIKAVLIARELEKMGCTQLNKNYFDTLKIALPNNISAETLRQTAEANRINLRYFENGQIGISTDETTTTDGIAKLLAVFARVLDKPIPTTLDAVDQIEIDKAYLRKTKPLQHDIFEKYHSETEMMRYITRLARKDISLAQSMIPLGSCTMKLNSAMSLFPLSWVEFQGMHPFAPLWQAKGYQELIENLCACLAEITGFAAVSIQPNSGAAGEYAGIMTIRNYLKSIGQDNRNIVLIPASAHGTNPATAVQAGYEVVVTACDDFGNVDVADLRAKAEQYSDRIAALMITYPSTHGVFEPAICEICEIIHKVGGQVYMDGANMNAQVGLTSPGFIGADVCHLNLHKTFSSPHGGGGPGVGPIGVAKHLIPFLPQHAFIEEHSASTAVSSAPWGSAGIACITYAYIRMMGVEGLTQATEIAILNANYLARRLEDHYGIVYTGATGRVGHEMILECRHLKADSGITESDIAKRLMDFGFHAPTLSFPVHGTLMIEPTESESLEELNRFVDTLLVIRDEIDEVAEGKYPKDNNVLVNAPHPDYVVAANEWSNPYSREKAAFPLPWVKENKFWLPVARVDNAYGDRNLFCTCSE